LPERPPAAKIEIDTEDAPADAGDLLDRV